MPETEKTYYSEPQAVAGEAMVVDAREAEGKVSVVLDRSIFYPEGGGQPCDLGILGGSAVLNVQEEGPMIVHTVEGPFPYAAGDRVPMAIDAKRRRDNSQQHSGQHLLSAVLEREYGIHTLGFHLGAAYCTIDVSCPGLDAGMIAGIETAVEDFIVRDVPYIIHACPPEDPESFPIRKKLPVGQSLIRIVEIGGYDWVACCGTHVPSAGLLRAFRILSTEKYKGNTRIYFVAGDRAVALMRGQQNLLKAIAAGLGTSAEEAPSRVASLLLRCGALETERSAMIRERAGMEIELTVGLASGTKPPRLPQAFRAGNRCIFHIQTAAPTPLSRRRKPARRGDTASSRRRCPTGPSASRRLTRAAQGQPSAQPVTAQPGTAQPAGIQLGAALKPLMQEIGGKGGGGPNSFRAVFATAQAAESFASGGLGSPKLTVLLRSSIRMKRKTS